MSLYCYHCMNKLTEKDNVCPYCGKNNSFEVPVHHLLPGTILNSKFMVGEALGEGGFGITYIGRDMNLDIPVAVKEFYPNGFVSRNNTASQSIVDSISEDRKDFFIKGRERFLTESRILAKFSDEPGIVEVRDFFEENNTAYIVMEYLDGCNLKNYIKKNGLMTPEQALNFLFPVMEALKKIHSHGLIHRDISPDNIMYTGKAVKLLDFGAARSVTAEANKSLSVMLKPGFTPEEQYRSKGVQGPWTDIYALCATMYKLITGITPEDATQRFFDDSIKRPSQLGIKIAPNVEDAIVKGMSLKQSDRFQTIDELLDALTGAVTKTEEKTVTSQTIGNVFETEDKTTEQKTIYNGETIVPPLTKTEMLTSVDTSATQLKNDVASSASYPAEQFMPVADNSQKNSFSDAAAFPKKQSFLKKIIVILIVILFLAGLLGFVIVFFSQDKANKDGNSSDDENNGESQTESFYIESVSEQLFDTTLESDTEGDHVQESTEAMTEDATEETTFDVSSVMQGTTEDFSSGFVLEGVLYELPCPVEKFYNNGWVTESHYNQMKPGYESGGCRLSKNGKNIDVWWDNIDIYARKFGDCYITSVSTSYDAGCSFSCPKGISLASDKEYVIRMLGQADNYYNGDDIIDYLEQYTYNVNGTVVNFYFNENDGSIHLISYRAEQLNYISAAVETKMPDAINRYVEPTELGSDARNDVISIDGKLYRFPIPVKCLLDDGWKFDCSEDVIPGLDYVFCDFYKDGKTFYTNVRNIAEYPTTVENCIVDYLSVKKDDNTEIILSSMGNKGILGMHQSELDDTIKIYGEYYTQAIDDYALIYYYCDECNFDKYVDITYSLEPSSKTVFEVSVSKGNRDWISPFL